MNKDEPNVLLYDEMSVVYATKAVRCADQLLQCLRELNSQSNALLSMVVICEIEKAAGIKQRMEAIISALQGE